MIELAALVEAAKDVDLPLSLGGDLNFDLSELLKKDPAYPAAQILRDAVAGGKLSISTPNTPSCLVGGTGESPIHRTDGFMSFNPRGGILRRPGFEFSAQVADHYFSHLPGAAGIAPATDLLRRTYDASRADVSPPDERYDSGSGVGGDPRAPTRTAPRDPIFQPQQAPQPARGPAAMPAGAPQRGRDRAGVVRQPAAVSPQQPPRMATTEKAVWTKMLKKSQVGNLCNRLLNINSTVQPNIEFQQGNIEISLSPSFPTQGKTKQEILEQLQKALGARSKELKTFLDLTGTQGPKLIIQNASKLGTSLSQIAATNTLRAINMQVMLTTQPIIAIQPTGSAVAPYFSDFKTTVNDYQAAAALCQTVCLATLLYKQWFTGEWTGPQNSEEKKFGLIKHNQTGQDRAQKLALECCALLERGVRNNTPADQIFSGISREIHKFIMSKDDKYAMGAKFFKPKTTPNAHSFITFFMRTLRNDPKLGLDPVQQEAAKLVQAQLDPTSSTTKVATAPNTYTDKLDLVKEKDRVMCMGCLTQTLGMAGGPSTTPTLRRGG